MRKYLSIQIMLVFLGFMFVTRGILVGYAAALEQISININTILVFLMGAVYDVCTALYFLPIVLVTSLALPKMVTDKLLFRFFIIFIAVYYLILNGVGELLFWDEFGTRFNFIAVDYLIYMDEVVKNIYESYPIIKISLIAALCSLIISAILVKIEASRKVRLKECLLSLLFCGLTYGAVSETTFELSNRYENELAHNGIYTLFAAFKNNSLNYPSFYKTIDNNQAFKVVQGKLGIDENGTTSITRFINNGKTKGYNVILITVESLSAEYMGRFGNRDNLTPFLDSISKKSLFFTNFYATGTRTVRGLEAITLSVPPTPGNSIVRMPGNENLFSLGSVLHQHNYSSKFLYGGFGYFDNMNHFFSNNHFQAVDRSSLSGDEITFANAWGVADEDVYRRAIKEADQDFAANKNFFYFVMTTSNHRPFTYPDNKITIPSGNGRNGAVRYTDFAVQKLIEAARKKPWFDNTIFVITADHCAGSSGKNDLPPERYHIPLLIYAPKLLQAREIDTISSQIDLAPTILAIMGLSYESRFYGTNALYSPSNKALISTYQKLGYYKPGQLLVLGPKQEVSQYIINGNKQEKLESTDEGVAAEAISFYQSAYYLFSNGLMKE